MEINRTGTVLELHTQRGKKILSYKQIVYIKSEKNKTILFLESANTIQTNHLLKWFTSSLPNPIFCRCHNSYIVNCKHVDYLCGTYAVLYCGLSIPVSKKKYNSLRDSLIKFQEIENNSNDNSY